MKICFATSECRPFMKAGGLGDVSNALPAVLSKLGAEVTIAVPLYGTVDRDGHRLVRDESLSGLQVEVGGVRERADIYRSHLPDSDVGVLFVHSDKYFDRPYLYSDDPDEDERYIFFQRAVLSALESMQWIPDVLHANDWATALLPVYLDPGRMASGPFRSTASVLSIHNIGYQGTFRRETIGKAGLSYTLAGTAQPFEYFGGFSFLKAGICFADVVATVSPTYAGEILQPEYGRGLHGVIAARGDGVRGILNGIDKSVWNPATDELIPRRYDARSLDAKSHNTKALRERFCLTGSGPVVGIISRLTEQKGFYLLEPVLSRLLDENEFELVVLGSGDRRLQELFECAALEFPDRVGVQFGYDEPLAHLIEAGADVFLMPSIYEPCGLNQMYSMVYGTVPVARRTGGLADTIRDPDDYPDSATGFLFDDADPIELEKAVQRILRAYPDRERWRAMQTRGMQSDFSWDLSAAGYMQVYEEAIQDRRTKIG